MLKQKDTLLKKKSNKKSREENFNEQDMLKLQLKMEII